MHVSTAQQCVGLIYGIGLVPSSQTQDELSVYYNTDITIEPFTQDSGPYFPENFDVSVTPALDYFSLLLKPEIFSGIKDHTDNNAIFKHDEIQRNGNNPDYVHSVWQETTVEELKAFFGMNTVMGL